MTWDGVAHDESPAITEVRMADLFEGTEFVAVNDALDIPAGTLRDVCSGEIPDPDRIRNRPVVSPAAAQVHAKTIELRREIQAVLQRSGLTEDRLAKRLGIGPARLADMSFQLWKSTFGEERDRRAGPDANQQKKGRITRELRAELQKAMADGDD